MCPTSDFFLNQQAAADRIRTIGPHILSAWEERVRQEIPVARNHSRVALIDSLPKFLDCLAQALQDGDATHEVACVALASEHAEMRVQFGDYTLGQVIAEYQVFRNTLVECLEEDKHLDPASRKILDTLVDIGIRAASESFVRQSNGQIKQAEKESEEERTKLAQMITNSASAIGFSATDVMEHIIAGGILPNGEQLIRETQSQFELAIEVSGIGFYDWNMVQDVVIYSRKMREDWGIEGSTPFAEAVELIHNDDRPRVLQEIEHAIQNKVPFQAEYRILRPSDQAIRWVEAQGIVHYDQKKKPVRIFGTARDITERIELQAHRENQIQWLENVLDQFPLPIVMVEADSGSIVFSNGAADGMFGSSVQIDKPAMSYGDIFYVTDIAGKRLETDELPAMRAARGEKLEGCEFIWRTPVGTFHVVMYSVAVPAMDGQTPIVVCPFFDVTSLKKTEYDLRDALKSLREEREVRERFVAALSHDLRTPLSSARLTAELIDQKFGEYPWVKKSAQRIVASLDRADRMIRDLLDANRLEAGQGIPIHPKPCRLDTFIPQIVDQLKLIYGDRFQIALPLPPKEGVWDPSGLERMIENLVSNAIKYGEPQQKITIAAKAKPDGISLLVHNFGNPIPLNEQSRLFEQYARAESAVREGKKGWGIGLTLVKGLAQAHGGSVFVESNEQDGTTFGIDLPWDSRQDFNEAE